METYPEPRSTKDVADDHEFALLVYHNYGECFEIDGGGPVRETFLFVRWMQDAMDHLKIEEARQNRETIL